MSEQRFVWSLSSNLTTATIYDTESPRRPLVYSKDVALIAETTRAMNIRIKVEERNYTP